MSKTAKLSLGNTLVLIALIIAEYYGWLSFEMWLSYQWHVLLHLVGVWLFLGNIAVGPVWIMFANKTKDPTTLKYAFRMLLLTDVLVTIPGIDMTVINGLCLSSAYNGFENQPWLLYSVYALFALWILVVPILLLQDRLYNLVKRHQIIGGPYSRAFIWWQIVGGISMIPVVLIFYWMVMKAV